MLDGQTLIPGILRSWLRPGGTFPVLACLFWSSPQLDVVEPPVRIELRCSQAIDSRDPRALPGVPSPRDAPVNALPPVRRSGGTMGEGQRPDTVAVAEEEPHPEITLRQISAWSLAILAAIAVGFLLYAAREVMLPVVAAFVVGIMLGPAARQTRSAARSAPACCAAAGGRRDADLRFRHPVDLPARVRTCERLAGHGRVAEGKAARL